MAIAGEDFLELFLRQDPVRLAIAVLGRGAILCAGCDDDHPVLERNVGLVWSVGQRERRLEIPDEPVNRLDACARVHLDPRMLPELLLEVFETFGHVAALNRLGDVARVAAKLLVTLDQEDVEPPAGQ